MPAYTYVGISDSGERVDGVVEAFDEIEAMEKARELCGAKRQAGARK